MFAVAAMEATSSDSFQESQLSLGGGGEEKMAKDAGTGVLPGKGETETAVSGNRLHATAGPLLIGYYFPIVHWLLLMTPPKIIKNPKKIDHILEK